MGRSSVKAYDPMDETYPMDEEGTGLELGNNGLMLAFAAAPRIPRSLRVVIGTGDGNSPPPNAGTHHVLGLSAVLIFD